MTEILTESFCERCGTRYTFESVAPRQKRLGGIKTLGRGLKNFVLSDDSSLDEAMAAARSDAERESTTQQLDAFHRTFNFCMSCRQYTCANCWNGVEARCLSCAPLPGVADTAQPMAEPDIERLLRLTAPPSETAVAGDHVHDHEHVDDLLDQVAAAGDGQPFAPAEGETAAEPAWPGEHEAAASGLPAWAVDAGIQPEADAGAAATDDEPFEDDVLTADDLAARLGGAPSDAGWAPEADQGAEAAASWAEPEPEAAAEPPAAAEPEAVEGGLEPEPAAAAAPDTTEPALEAPVAALEAADGGLVGLEPGASLEDAIAAYEASLAAEGAGTSAASAEAAPALAEAPAPEPVAAVALDAVAEAPEGPLAADVAPEAAPARPQVDVVEQPTWPIPAPQPEPVAADIAPEPAAEPEPVAAEAQPEAAPTPPPVQPAAPPAPSMPADAPTGAPQWPTGPRWPTSIPARQPVPPPAPAVDPLTALMARQATEAMWALSSRDVVQPPAATVAPVAGVQPCVSCGISLSANARFCRRCGTSQVG